MGAMALELAGEPARATRVAPISGRRSKDVRLARLVHLPYGSVAECVPKPRSEARGRAGHIRPAHSVFSLTSRDRIGHQRHRSTRHDQPPNPPPRGIPSIVNRLNPLVRRLLALGLPMGPNVLITVRGRKSGRPYTFPVAILERDGREYLFSPFGEVNWVHNLRAAGEATIRRGRRDRRMTAVELSPRSPRRSSRRACGR